MRIARISRPCALCDASVEAVAFGDVDFALSNPRVCEEFPDSNVAEVQETLPNMEEKVNRPNVEGLIEFLGADQRRERGESS